MESNSHTHPQGSASPTALVGHENSHVSRCPRYPANHRKLITSCVGENRKNIWLFQPLKSPKEGASSIFYISHVLHISQIFINSTIWTTASMPADLVFCQANTRKTIKHIPATLLLLQRVVRVPTQGHLQLKHFTKNLYSAQQPTNIEA